MVTEKSSNHSVKLTKAMPGHGQVESDMKSYIPLETAAIFFLANLFLKQALSSEYVMVDFICMVLLDL